MDPKWYLKRLASMGPSELVGRVQDAGRRRTWKHRPPEPPALAPTPVRHSPVVPPALVDGVDRGSRQALLAEAEGLLAGRWTMFGRPRADMTANLDYFIDFVSGTRAPSETFAFDINHRHEDEVGNIKFVWEPARHHHLTVLAVAYALSGREAYAERIQAELTNFWQANPFLTGIHWTSGIELGIRLLSWTWIRRLLDGWPGAPALFEENPAFIEQLGRHHQWIHSLGSHGSSANNHVIAEAAGQFVAATAFPLFSESDRWRVAAAEALVVELERQTFPEGLNRELASDYHGLVLELATAAWTEAVLVRDPVVTRLVGPVVRAYEALHAVVDCVGRPHRQGDADDAHGLLLDPIGYDRWRSLLRTAALVAEPSPWWVIPSPGGRTRPSDVRTALLARCAEWAGPTTPSPEGRPAERPSVFPEAGISILRDHRGPEDNRLELWCAFDHGPHGFLSTAAHAHADALAVEIRCGGVEVVVDPGTYCYHGQREWRDHFRSTLAHATVTIDGTDQSEMAGPFLWTRKAHAFLERSSGLDRGPVAEVVAGHDGYLPIGVIHRRSVSLDREARTIEIVDRIQPEAASTEDGSEQAEAGSGPDRHTVDVVFPLGPDVGVNLSPDGRQASLTWDEPEPEADAPNDAHGGGIREAPSRYATVTLDAGLAWRLVSGGLSPFEGWYSPHFGSKQPSMTLIGTAVTDESGGEYSTLFTFATSPEHRAQGEAAPTAAAQGSDMEQQ